MSLKSLINDHKKGHITFLQLGRPQFICLDDDDFIYYINYCWEFLGFAHEKIKAFSVYNDDDHEFIISLAKEVGRTHAIIELCHKFLSGQYNMPDKKKIEVYTTTMAHERR